MEQIKGGYYIMARKLSWIDSQPPHTREIFRYFIRNATHSNERGKLKRGQLLCTYKQILDALSWYAGWRKMSYKKHDCENSVKALKKAVMITTKKTTRGMIVTVCNYETYQTQKNYESHTRAQTAVTRGQPQSTDRIGNKGIKKKEGKSLMDIQNEQNRAEIKRIEQLKLKG